MNAIEIIILIATFFVVLVAMELLAKEVVLRRFNKKGIPVPASGVILDNWASFMGLERENYGSEIETKPNEHCHWLESAVSIFGWSEDDDHLRGRIHTAMRER